MWLIKTVIFVIEPLKEPKPMRQEAFDTTRVITPIGWSEENVTVEDDLVYYNRVPKAGSTTMLQLVRLLSKGSSRT